MMRKIFVQITVACLLLAIMVSAQDHDDHDHHEGDGHDDHDHAPGSSSNKTNSAVIVAADMFTGLVASTVALVVGFIYWDRNSLSRFLMFVCCESFFSSSFVVCHTCRPSLKFAQSFLCVESIIIKKCLVTFTFVKKKRWFWNVKWEKKS